MVRTKRVGIHFKGKEEPQTTYRLIRSTDVGMRFEAAAIGLTRFVGRNREMTV